MQNIHKLEHILQKGEKGNLCTNPRTTSQDITKDWLHMTSQQSDLYLKNTNCNGHPSNWDKIAFNPLLSSSEAPSVIDD